MITFSHVTLTRPLLSKCTINVPNANLLYWYQATSSYSESWLVDSETSQGTIPHLPVTESSPYSFPVAASTRFVEVTTGEPVVARTIATTSTHDRTTRTYDASAYTATVTSQASIKTLPDSDVTKIITYSATTYMSFDSARSYTPTNIAFPVSQITDSAPIVSDVLRRNITYKGVTYAYIATSPTPYILCSVLETQQASSSSTITVPVPFFTAYHGDPYVDWSGNSAATGTLPPTLIEQMAAYEDYKPSSNCVIGNFKGQVTLDVAIIPGVQFGPSGLSSVSQLGPVSANAGVVLLSTSNTSKPAPSFSSTVFTPVTTSSSPRSSPLPGNTSPDSSSPSGKSSTYPMTTWPASQASREERSSQTPSSHTTTTLGLGGLIMSALGVTQAPKNGTTIATLAVPGTSATGSSSASTTLTVTNIPGTLSSNNIVLNSQVVNVVSVNTFDNVVFVATKSGSLVVESTMIPVPSTVTSLPSTSFSSFNITVNSKTQLVIVEQTLSSGSVITVFETSISLVTGTSSVVIGTTVLATPSTQSASRNLTSSTGAALSKKRGGGRGLWICVAIGAGVLVGELIM